MKNYLQIWLSVSLILAFTAPGSFAQFTFVDLSDLHITDIPTPASDTNAQYFQCYIKEFANLIPKPAFVAVSGDIGDIGSMAPDGMYPTLTQYLFPPSQTNPLPGGYFIDSAQTIPIYFTPGNHDYWYAFETNETPLSNDTLAYYSKYVTQDTDYVITTDIAVIVLLRSGHDTPTFGDPPNPDSVKGNGLSDEQCGWLRNILSANSNKRKIIVMHHPAVNAAGTNSDGTPVTFVIADTAQCSISNNRTTFLNICDSNHVDLVLNGHEHQNVVADRQGNIVDENWPDGTRYVQTAAAFNRSYRIITVSSTFVTVGAPQRSCNATSDVNELSNQADISVFPNPAGDQLTIGCNQKATIEILNIQGQIVSATQHSEIRSIIDLANLSKGIYIIRARTDNGIIIEKFIKE
jgi:3',5'-cyclic AMP phosphodiesterase CpdA